MRIFPGGLEEFSQGLFLAILCESCAVREVTERKEEKWQAKISSMGRLLCHHQKLLHLSKTYS